MKNNRQRHWLCVVVFLVAVGTGSALAGDADDPTVAKGKAKPGLAVHYYGDQPFWGGNWTSEFLPKVNPEKWVFSNYLFSRVENVVNHSFVKRSWFSLRMSGYVTVPDVPADAEAGGKDVTFYLVIDQGARVLVDGKLVTDGWMPKLGGGREIKGTVLLTPGTHTLVVEGFVGANNRLKDGLILRLLWQSDGYGIKKAIIPVTALSHDAAQLVPKPGRTQKTQPKTVTKP